MTSESDHLIAVSTERKQYAKGAGLFDSGENLAHKLQQDWDTVAVSVGAVAVGLDFLSFVVNPLGELVKAGVGWLMENLAFLREPLDLLAGDPDQIKMIAQTWNNIADELAAAADTYDGALSTVAGWGGDSAINYRALAVGYTEALRGTAEQARSAAQGVTTAGIVVGTTRAILFDIIATFISNVITRALLAMASSWCTFGASVAVFVTSVIADVVKIMAKIQKHLGKLLGALQRFVKNYSVLGDGSAKAAKALGRKSSELGREANQAVKQANKTLDNAAPILGRAKAYESHINGEGTSKISDILGGGSTAAKVTTHDGTRLAKEAAKSTAGMYEQYDGGSKEAGRVRDDSAS